MAKGRFVQGLSRGLNLPAIGQAVARRLEIAREEKRREDERQRKIEEQRQQQSFMQNILGKLSAGGENQLQESPTFGTPIAEPNMSQPMTIGNMITNRKPSLGNMTSDINVPERSTELTSRFQPYAPQDKMNLFMMLDNQTRDDYKKGQDLFNPTPKAQKTIKVGNKLYYESPDIEGVPIGDPIYEYPKRYSNYKYDRPDGIYAVNEDTGLEEKVQDVNPHYVEKPLHTVTDYNSRGEKVIREVYRGGKHVDYPTGFYKDKSGDEFDEKKYSEILTKAANQESDLNKLREQYNNPDLETTVKEGIKYRHNVVNESAERNMYLRLTDEGRNFVDDQFDEMKKSVKGKKIQLSEYEKQNQQALKQAIIDATIQKFKDGEISYDDARGIKLWAGFKYGYIR